MLAINLLSGQTQHYIICSIICSGNKPIFVVATAIAHNHVRCPPQQLATLSMDILHPLATLHWKRRYDCLYYSTLVKNGDKLYLLDGYTTLRYASLTDLTSWTTLPLPHITQFALTTYQNQLVLVGGVRGNTVLNEVWSSADGTNWQHSLPPIPTPRHSAKAAGCDDPECLVVVGGVGQQQGLGTSVDVLVQGVWFATQPVPVWPNYVTILNGNLFINTSKTSACYCPIKSLLAIESLTAGANMEPAVVRDNIQLIATGMSSEVLARACWKEMSLASEFESTRNLVSLDECVLVLTSTSQHLKTEIHAYLPLAQRWVPVQYSAMGISALLAISSWKMVAITIIGLYEVTLKVSPYDPDSQFSRSALAKLEAAGMPVVTSLERVWERLAAAIGAGHYSSYDNLLKQWTSESTQVPPTWRSLYDVLRELGLEDLAREIEDYLSCPRSLREQCTSVIMSALQQQRSLEPDQLHARLPDYVPTTLRQHLTDTWRLILAPPPSPSP